MRSRIQSHSDIPYISEMDCVSPILKSSQNDAGTRNFSAIMGSPGFNVSIRDSITEIPNTVNHQAMK
jgi:hypothetical protein